MLGLSNVKFCIPIAYPQSELTMYLQSHKIACAEIRPDFAEPVPLPSPCSSHYYVVMFTPYSMDPVSRYVLP